jgi:hypothetical protein
LYPAEVEQRLIDHIFESQQKSGCFSHRECRAFASNLLTTSTHTVFINRFWWRRFLQRTPELAVCRLDASEMARAVTKEDMLPYLENLQRVVSDEFHPDLVINRSEPRFCQRPFKDSEKNCVFIRIE